mmetsp:Transcript_7596/g.18840  ORF Transcript_7596/g.18840 Transcript_7596/m.18840 type:complete len:237 (-) Transcript_7596:22-732(-)
MDGGRAASRDGRARCHPNGRLAIGHARQQAVLDLRGMGEGELHPGGVTGQYPAQGVDGCVAGEGGRYQCVLQQETGHLPQRVPRQQFVVIVIGPLPLRLGLSRGRFQIVKIRLIHPAAAPIEHGGIGVVKFLELVVRHQFRRRAGQHPAKVAAEVAVALGGGRQGIVASLQCELVRAGAVGVGSGRAVGREGGEQGEDGAVGRRGGRGELEAGHNNIVVDGACVAAGAGWLMRRLY